MSQLGLTQIEAILSRAIGHRVHAGETIVAPVDRVLVQDGTAPRVFERLKALDVEHPALADRTVLFFDHGAPPPTPAWAKRQKMLRLSAARHGITISPAGAGISHQCMVENYVLPGELIVGADSHTCSLGVLGAIGLGMGSTDVACAIALGECWLVVPETVRLELHGELAAGVTTKDFMLQHVGRLGAAGANYEALEFAGPALSTLGLDDRFVLANLAAELGAKTALLPVDDVTRAYLESRGRTLETKAPSSDKDASYLRRLKANLGEQRPVVARPGHHDDVVAVEDVEGETIDQVVIGSCTNGRVADFEAAARILEGRRVHPSTQLIVVPASAEVLDQVVRSGAMRTLVAAGATLVTPGCGPCTGVHQGVLGPGQSCLATQSRNFPGRMGDSTAKIWLGSPLTAAATAVTGRLTDPREVLHGA